MQNFINNKLLRFLKLKLNLKEFQQLLVWQNIYNFEEPFPNFIKQKVLEKYSSKDTIWVETGTYEGDTAKFLSEICKFVYTIEPSKKFFTDSKVALSKLSNLKIVNGTSEDCLEKILSEIDEGSTLSLWLDGHWSGGETFRGHIDTPIEFELNAISKYINKFKKVSVLVDDVRLFDESYEKVETYPNKNILINWASQNNLNWTITRDIFIAY